ncbi:MAG TPA: hypothetical protein VKS81_11585, partial [Bacteroidota bacterium]|nr:hypothetical protein [Bacteroidota bacterium]
QRNALREVFRLLRDGGALYLAIENKDSHRYRQGYPDDHTGIRHISYLSRERADQRSREIRGRGYRTYTYNRGEYEELLKSAGFSTIKCFYPYPDYKTFSSLAPLDSTEIRSYMLSHLDSVEHSKEEMLTLVAERKNFAVESGIDGASSFLIKATK